LGRSGAHSLIFFNDHKAEQAAHNNCENQVSSPLGHVIRSGLNLWVSEHIVEIDWVVGACGVGLEVVVVVIPAVLA
tara:strand:- start:112 stop:339 length:228 start_codon:yes stop_codon:yes gene_type:complete